VCAFRGRVAKRRARLSDDNALSLSQPKKRRQPAAADPSATTPWYLVALGTLTAAAAVARVSKMIERK
jgi:hypothetical protein